MIPLGLEKALRAANRYKEDNRTHAIGAAARRHDGVWVVAKNGASEQVQPSAHAEIRVLRKAGYGASLYVARMRKDGTPGLARPCARCLASLRPRGISRVYYTIGVGEYGVLDI